MGRPGKAPYVRFSRFRWLRGERGRERAEKAPYARFSWQTRVNDLGRIVQCCAALSMAHEMQGCQNPAG